MHPFEPSSAVASSRRNKIRAQRAATQRPYVPYMYSEDAELAVKVALATGRPLLLRGEAGCGKSTMAFDAAVVLGWTYYEKVFTSRTTAGEVMWSVDSVRRLADATAHPELARENRNYVTPEVLWWAFDAESAGKFAPGDPGEDSDPDRTGAVVLLDEIDKADPDVPNDLLQPLGDNRFAVHDLPGLVVNRKRPLLLVVTSNQERALTRAFLRRCVCLTFPPPDAAWLEMVARRHYPEVSSGLLAQLVEVLMKHRKHAPDGAHRPGVSELLDAIRACQTFGIADETHADWDRLARVLMKKHEGEQ